MSARAGSRPASRLVALLLLGAITAGCVRAPGAAPRSDAAVGRPLSAAAPTSVVREEGMLPVPGGRIWYRVAGTASGTPVIAIHGGPGGTSCRLRELSRLTTERPVVFYDQLGTGRSERVADTTLWVLPRFVAEIDSIRSRLGLKEVVLAGFSWGSTVAAEYALTRPNSGVRAVVLGSPLLSTPRWIADADTLVATLPAPLRRTIAIADSTGRYDTPEYLAAVDSFYVRYLSRARTNDFPECAAVTGNDVVYNYMWGPSEFRSTGTLRDYDRSGRLGELRMPVLLITGEFDEARPSTVRDFQRMIPGAELVVVPGAAHALLVDAPALTMAAIRDFLARSGVR